MNIDDYITDRDLTYEVQVSDTFFLRFCLLYPIDRNFKSISIDAVKDLNFLIFSALSVNTGGIKSILLQDFIIDSIMIECFKNRLIYFKWWYNYVPVEYTDVAKVSEIAKTVKLLKR